MSTLSPGEFRRLELEELESRDVPSSSGFVPFNGGYDLETGYVYYDYRGIDYVPSPPVDMYFAYNGANANHLVLMQRGGAAIAFLSNTPFESVNYATASSLLLTQEPINRPLNYNDTIVIRTMDGNVFKVGMALEVSNGGYPWVSFRFEKLNDPVAALNSLINTVQASIPDAKAFLVKLEQTQKALSSPNADTRQDAIHQIQAFINAVFAQSDKKLTITQANTLASQAQGLVDLLSVSGPAPI